MIWGVLAICSSRIDRGEGRDDVDASPDPLRLWYLLTYPDRPDDARQIDHDVAPHVLRPKGRQPQIFRNRDQFVTRMGKKPSRVGKSDS